MAAHLNSGKVNLFLLRESYRKELLKCLEVNQGSKALIWDEKLANLFGLLCDSKTLKATGVDRMFQLSPGRLGQNDCVHIIYLVRPKLDFVEMIADNIRREKEAGLIDKKEYHILFSPYKNVLCEKKLKELNVFDLFASVDEFSVEIIPFDNDLLSMEWNSCFRDCYLYNDFSPLFHVAKAIMKIQSLYGTIPTIYGKGACAKQVCDILQRLRKENQESAIPPQIDQLLIFDRIVDPLSSLLSQLTYEGLIDELYTIQNTTVQLPANLFPAGTSEAASETKRVTLNSGDELVAEVRDRNFNAVGAILGKRAKQLNDVQQSIGSRSVSEMKELVSKLPQYQAMKQSLANHTTIAGLIKEHINTDDFRDGLRCQQDFLDGVDTDKVSPYIEDCIARQEPIVKVLRLVCIQSVVSSGLKPKVLEHYKREIIQTYGYEHLLTLHNLERVGLLSLEGQRTLTNFYSQGKFNALKKALKLVVRDISEQAPTDIAYVFIGYAPLTARLAQYSLRPGWRQIRDKLDLLPGPTVEETQAPPAGFRKRRGSDASSLSNVSAAGDQKVTLVWFIGGVTYAEIAALRFLSQQEDTGSEFIIASTNFWNGNSWMKSLTEKTTIDF